MPADRPQPETKVASPADAARSSWPCPRSELLTNPANPNTGVDANHPAGDRAAGSFRARAIPLLAVMAMALGWALLAPPPLGAGAADRGSTAHEPRRPPFVYGLSDRTGIHDRPRERYDPLGEG